MGELLLSNLEYKSFSDFATDLLGARAGYFTGWTYWFCWVVTGMADVVAITAYAHFWFPHLADWIISLSCVCCCFRSIWSRSKCSAKLNFGLR